MAESVEVLTPTWLSRSAREIVHAMRDAAPVPLQVRPDYHGDCDLLLLWGIGHPESARARDRHVATGRRALLWDMGYFGKLPRGGHFRVSIDHEHPQGWLDQTPANGARWAAQGIELREDFDPDGRIVLVGMGPKSHAFLRSHGWEQHKLAELRRRFPRRRIVFRPKPGKPTTQAMACEVDRRERIEDVIRGASLVVCRHSNVAIDACIAGVPIETEDGAAAWLRGKAWCPEVRLDFLRRLAHWNWKATEAVDAWKFLLQLLARQ